MCKFVRRICLRAAVVGVLFAVVGILFPTTAQAHEASATLVTVTTSEDRVALDVQVPLDRLEVALDTELTDDPAASVAGLRDQLTDLFQERVTLATPAGEAWTTSVDSLELSSLDAVDTLRLAISAAPPTGATTGALELGYNVITDVIYSHKVVIALATAAGEPELLGVITHYQPTLVIETSPGSSTQATGFGAMVTLGFTHFREGADHLLFLVLVALGAAGRRTTIRATLTRLAVLTACFTLGHSLSLALAALGWVSLPTSLVETGIAITIVLAAIHAVRPLVRPSAEVAFTVAFGLIHGFGFAGTLADLSLSGWELALPLLGFNLGLEAAQLGGLAVVAIPLWLIARSRVATTSVATAIGAVGIAWIAQRALGFDLAWVDTITATIAATPERLALVLGAGLVVATIAAQTWDSRRPSWSRRAWLKDSSSQPSASARDKTSA